MAPGNHNVTTNGDKCSASSPDRFVLEGNKPR